MSKNLLLHLDKLTIFFRPTVHRKQTLRDVFVSFFASPLKTFSRSRDKYIVMDKITAKFFRGEVIGLIGINGVGKTTLCRYLSGIIKSDQVKIYGEVRAIFDNSICFYPNLTGRENAIILAEIMYPELSKFQKEEIIKEALHFSELTTFLDSPMNTYSRGMKARLYLSLVTAKEADILILDEIFGGTDIFFLEKLEERIRRIVKNSGSVIIVSHDRNDIVKYCNRAIVLAEKKIVFDGPPEVALSFYSQKYGHEK